MDLRNQIESHVISMRLPEIYAIATGIAMGLQGEIDPEVVTSAMSIGATKFAGQAYQKTLEGNRLVFDGSFHYTAYRNPGQQSVLEGTLGAGAYAGIAGCCYLIGQALTNFF